MRRTSSAPLRAVSRSSSSSLAKLLGDPRGEAFDLEHDARERLADLVVQLARDPLTLALLDHQGPAGALALLGLQPVEHLVEGVGERCDLRASLDVDAVAGRQRVMPAHVVRQLVEGPERRTHEHEADYEREGHTCEQADRFGHASAEPTWPAARRQAPRRRRRARRRCPRTRARTAASMRAACACFKTRTPRPSSSRLARVLDRRCVAAGR